MNNSNLDSIIFSVTYENYIKNISIDKPDKKLGKWSLSEQMTNHIKFAYEFPLSSTGFVETVDRYKRFK